MQYREDLPDGCPGAGAAPLSEPEIFYRLVDGFPPTDADFDSVWKLEPHRRDNLDPCFGRGVSLWNTPESAQRRAKLPTLIGKIVCRVNVTPGSGPVERTSTHHYAWWPLREHDILPHCSEYQS